jgi:hypothetical protein
MDDFIVADEPSNGLPSSVYKRDGRLVAFEADKISESLYAATEDLGKPSPFLARELTDGVLHFLAAEAETEPPTTNQIAELVAKVVGELGQPALAQVYAERQRRNHQETPAAILREKKGRSERAVHFSTKDAPDTVVRQCLRSFSLEAIFARDVAAAHEEGLLSLTGLAHPEEFARTVMEPNAGENGWLAHLNVPARTIILDSPEYALTEKTARSWLLGLAEFCETTGRTALINLHVASPPAWAHPGAQGPLFAPGIVSTAADQSTLVADLLFQEIQQLGTRAARAEWHLSEVDFTPENMPLLQNAIRHAVEGGGLGFTLDRPRQRLVLAPGVDRRHAAVLLDVGLDLRRFLGMSGVDHDARLLLEKLPSLARMAVRAGIQKRNFLRLRCADRPGLARGFLLERARLVVVPVGLSQVVEDLLGHGMAGSALSLDLGLQIVETLQRTLHKEGLAANLEIALDGPDGEFPGFSGPLDSKQLHAAGALHGVAGFGTVVLAESSAEKLLALLSYAWKKTAVVRLRVDQSMRQEVAAEGAAG